MPPVLPTRPRGPTRALRPTLGPPPGAPVASRRQPPLDAALPAGRIPGGRPWAASDGHRRGIRGYASARRPATTCSLARAAGRSPRVVMPLRFVHVSDIHLLDLQGVRPWHYLNKRITGRVNLALKRRRGHDEQIFDRAVEHGLALGAERLVVTGDLSNLSLPSEFAHVRRRLASIGLPVTVIPGNHDAYTKGVVRDNLFDLHFREFMDGERVDGDFPFVQRFDEVALIGVSTAVTSLPLYATGTVGRDQLERLDAVLARLGEQHVVRVVLIHHPPVAGVAKARHDLRDLDAFGEVIARRGAELILHGHEHRNLETILPGPGGAVPVHGIASGTSRSQRPGHEAAFSLYQVDRHRIHRELYTWNGTSFARAHV